jgi:hypothetical protein
MRVCARWSVFGLLVLFSAAGAQEATQAQRYVIPGHGSLLLKVPRAWLALGKPLETPPSVALVFRPASGSAFSVQLTSAWLEPDKLAGFTAESIRSKTQDSAAKLLPEAEEKEVAAVELRGAESIGYYFSLTSRGAPSGPEDYKYMTRAPSGRARSSPSSPSCTAIRSCRRRRRPCACSRRLNTRLSRLLPPRCRSASRRKATSSRFPQAAWS